MPGSLLFAETNQVNDLRNLAVVRNRNGRRIPSLYPRSLSFDLSDHQTSTAQSNRQREKNKRVISPNNGTKIGRANLKKYSEKLGMFTLAFSEIDFTRKFGPLPM